MDDFPPYTEPQFPVPEDERITVFDWMALTCFPAEFERQSHLADLAAASTGPNSADARTPGQPSDAERLQMD